MTRKLKVRDGVGVPGEVGGCDTGTGSAMPNPLLQLKASRRFGMVSEGASIFIFTFPRRKES